jgi:hypothetical protein
MNGEGSGLEESLQTVTFDAGKELTLDTSNIDLTQKLRIKSGVVDAPELFDAFIAGYKTSLQREIEASDGELSDAELREKLENEFTDWVETHVNNEIGKGN